MLHTDAGGLKAQNSRTARHKQHKPLPHSRPPRLDWSDCTGEIKEAAVGHVTPNAIGIRRQSAVGTIGTALMTIQYSVLSIIAVLCNECWLFSAP